MINWIFPLFLTIFKFMEGITEAWEQVVEQVQLLVVILLQHADDLSYEELVDTAALVFQIMRYRARQC